MFNWFWKLLVYQGAKPIADSRCEEMRAAFRAAEEKAWWRDMTGLVSETDQQLVVIGPRSDATADELRGLGQTLAQWKAEFPQARHIWGLTDLLEGRHPRTPPVYIAGIPIGVRGSKNATSRWPWSTSRGARMLKQPQGPVRAAERLSQ
jgi:hypothetical protein